MKTNLKYTLPMFALVATSALTSCADKDSWMERGEADPNKELISFTSNGGETVTRASIDGTRAGFEKNTKIAMRIKAEDTKTGDGYPRDKRYTLTFATAKAMPTSWADDTHNGDNLLPTSFSHSDVEITGTNYRYWDDAFGRDSKLSVYAVCVPNKASDAVLSNSLLSDAGTPVHATNNPNWKTETTENETLIWSVTTTNQTTEQTGLGSLVGKDATTGGTLENEDLCYSNNIREGAATDEKGVYRSTYSSGDGTWSTGLTNGQMIWNPKSTAAGETVGKFDQGHLIFKHALTKVTVNLTEGSGFDNSISTDFAFTNATENLALLSFPTKGTFNLSDAKWTITESNGVSNLPEITTSANNGKTKVRSLQALALPEYSLETSPTDNAIRFTIDNNVYYVTKQQIQTAISTWATANSKTEVNNNFHVLKQGYHYEINITVGKKQIDKITAEIVDWETVGTNPIDPQNAFIQIALEERGVNNKVDKYESGKADYFDLYRAAVSPTDDKFVDDNFVDYNWKTGYTTDGKADKVWDSEKSVWNSKWFWFNNKTAYHLRVAGNAETANDNPTITQDGTGDGDYFTIKAGDINGSTYNDYIWGAPFTDVVTSTTSDPTGSAKFVYTPDKGFDQQVKGADGTSTVSQIYKAIGPTESIINMMLFHMTCQIEVVVETSLSSEGNNVNLGDGTGTNKTTVEILRFYENGKVLLGNGREMPTGTSVKDAQEITAGQHTAESGTTPAKAVFTYGMVPQTLNRFTTGTDGNSFKVGLRITTSDGNQYVVQDLSKSIYATVSNNHLNVPYTTQGTGDNAGKYLVNYWYPGYKYTYNVKITKKGIDAITAELVDWETVTGNIGNITLED